MPAWGTITGVPPSATAVRSAQRVVVGGLITADPVDFTTFREIQQALFPSRLDHRHEQDPGEGEQNRYGRYRNICQEQKEGIVFVSMFKSIT